MKINLSLRLYMLAFLLTLMVVISGFFTWQTASHFLSGFDVTTERNMLDVAREVELDENGQGQVLGYHAVDNWLAVPAFIKQHFPLPPERHGELHKKFVDWSYFAPPETFYLLMMVQEKGQQYYIFRYRDKAPEKPYQPDGIDPMVKIVLWGLVIILGFWGLLLMMLRSIGRPIVALQQWAQGLTEQQTQQPFPDFRYRELNSLAHIIQSAVLKVKQTLKREQEFLSYASHELRTPIAVIRSNCALLEKVNTKPSSQEQAIRQRLQRASLTMKDMTETLLWLSREGEEALPVEMFNLEELVQQLTLELQYLLKGKQVELQLATQAYSLQLPKAACRILLTNLIRNAFQHTYTGQVRISQQGSKLTISNPLSEQNPEQNTELGFGLGLKLSQKLVGEFGWRMQTKQRHRYYVVELNLIKQ